MKTVKPFVGILWKLLLAFLLTMVVLAAAMHLLFQKAFFRRVYEQNLRAHTDEAAERVSACMRQEGFYDAFLRKDLDECAPDMRFLADYATYEYADIWVVAGDTVMLSYNENKDALEFDEIPTRYHPMVQRLLAGEAVRNAQYAGVWNRGMFGVGAPVLDANGAVIAAVITQISQSYVRATIVSANSALMLSCAVALPIAAALAMLLAAYCVSPLRQMRAAAARWETEDYACRTGVTRRDEFGALAESMDELAERLENQQARRAHDEHERRQFFADVSHELNTPVAVLRAQIEMLRDGIVDDPIEQRTCLTDSLNEITQMQRLIEDLLTLSRLQNPEFALDMRPVCLCDILEDLRRSHQPIAAERGVRLLLHGAEEGADKSVCTVTGDYTRIRQLLGILIDNAERYTPKGGTVTVRFLFDGAPVVTVRDDGPGMSAESLSHVFERYYSHYRSSGGSGLGLPIARQIALRHNATLSMESTPGEGTTAILRFPAKPL